MVRLMISGKMINAFIDTGSEATLLKHSAQTLIAPSRTSEPRRRLQGASGASLAITGERDVILQINDKNIVTHRVCIVDGVDFPGDILIGIDLLKRLDFRLGYDSRTNNSYLRLRGKAFTVRYVNKDSLELTAVVMKMKGMSVPVPPARAAIRRSVSCPPESGRFVPVRVPDALIGKQLLVEGLGYSVILPREVIKPSSKEAVVWVVNPTLNPVKLRNGTHLVELHEVEEMCDTPEAPGNVASIADTPVAAVPTSALEKISLKHLSDHRKSQVCKVLAQYPRLFSGDKFAIGEVPDIVHEIPTQEKHPLCQRQWRLPEAAKRHIREECEQMLKAGVIEPSSSPWLSPVVLVKKKDGTLRFCVDYRNLNSVTIADSYPLPRMDELLDELGGTSVFTLLDSRSAYWSIPVKPEDRPKTAFSDGHRLYQFRRMPFGLCTAPSTFQRTVNLVLSPVLGKHTIAYLDDIVVHSATFEEHIKHLNETLLLLDKAGFKLNLEKCDFAVSNFRFLGYRVTPQGFLPDPEKVKSIEEMLPPKNQKGVRRFLGAAGFFRKFVPKYAKIAAPLTRLTRKDVRFVWGPDQRDAFIKLKDLLITAPVLAKPDFEKIFELHTDASQVAIGACLMQTDDQNELHPIAYFSRKLRGAETRYSATDLEALAVVESVRHFDAYLYGRRFTVLTDHRPLTYVFSRRTKSPRMSRWSAELADHNFQIKYKQGRINYVPDMLSRDVAPISLSSPDPYAMRVEQLKDPLLHEIVMFLEERAVPQQRPPLPLDEFELRNGVLYRLRHLPERIVEQLVVPRTLRKDAIKIAHASPIAAHHGIYRTYNKLRDLFYFPNMLGETRKYVSSCKTCQKRKGIGRRAPLQHAPEAVHPMERVSADLVDLHSSSSGNRYVLVMVDQLTRYLQLVPLPNKEAETVVRAIIDHFITLFGPPRLLQTDGGLEFNNALFRSVCEDLTVQTHVTTAFHPQANGLVERTNRVVKDALATLVEDQPLDWDRYIPQVRFAINSAIHRAIGDQPLYLLTGQPGHFPVGLSNHVTAGEDAHCKLREALDVARKAAQEASRKARQEYAAYHNRNLRPPWSLEAGSLVLYKIKTTQTGPDRALGPRWQGPAKVVKKLGPVNYVVQDLSPPFSERNCHANQLRPFKLEEELTFPDASPYHDPDYVDPWLPDDAEPGATMLLSAIRPSQHAPQSW